MQKRNRKKQTTTVDERLRKFAEDERAAASRAPPGFERERLIRKADKAKGLSIQMPSSMLRREQTARRCLEREMHNFPITTKNEAAAASRLPSRIGENKAPPAATIKRPPRTLGLGQPVGNRINGPLD